MLSEWRVTSNYICGQTMYGIYRLKNKNEIDHSGNREYAGGYVNNREAASIVAAELNKGEANESNQDNN